MKAGVMEVRFEDRLAALLAQSASDGAAVAEKRRQLSELLAEREDDHHSPMIDQAIEYLGQAGSVSSAGIIPSATTGQEQIRALMGRVDALRKAQRTQARPIESFRWETGQEGLILWVEGAPRTAIIGQTIASPAAEGEFGVDGQAAGAFERRSPFRDVRLTVAGEGAASGSWRLSGVPFFDSSRGHFLGYRGSARRPRIDEEAAIVAAERQPGLFGTELPPDALRQLIHELRTPLNAIMGFAEMIDGEYLGPAAESYRARASRIREQAGQLLSAVDDLDTAARMETRHLYQVEESAVDIVALLYRLHQSYDRVAQQRYATLRLDFAQELPLAKVEPETAERMFSRMLAATIGLSEEGETLTASLSVEDVSGKKMLCLAIGRPRSILGVEEAKLLDPGYTPAGDWPAAPALGLGFALRLVRNLAEAAGGGLTIEDERFLLALPPLEADGEAASRNG